MLFNMFLQTENLSIKDVSNFLGCSYEAARLYTVGKRRPSAEYMEKIKAWSQGKVTADDFHEAYMAHLKADEA